MPANPTPADARALAEEAIRLAEEATIPPWHRSGHSIIQTEHITRDVWQIPRTEEDLDFIAHAGTHYATLARALLAALDERDALREQIAAEREVRDGTWCAQNQVEGRGPCGTCLLCLKALLADLPHALGACACKPTYHAWDETRQRSGVEWPEAHTAAVARLEGRIK